MPFPPELLRVYLGDYNTEVVEPHEREVVVAEVIVHPDYGDKPNNNDIALLRLTAPVELSAYIQPIAIAENIVEDALPGEMGIISGWGNTSSGGSSPDKLLIAQVPIVSNQRCAQTYGDDITPGMICAGYEQGGVDTCQGDSGGPMAIATPLEHRLLVGITSWGAGCADPGTPGVYVRVAHYGPWIRSFVPPVSSVRVLAPLLLENVSPAN